MAHSSHNLSSSIFSQALHLATFGGLKLTCYYCFWGPFRLWLLPIAEILLFMYLLIIWVLFPICHLLNHLCHLECAWPQFGGILFLRKLARFSLQMLSLLRWQIYFIWQLWGLHFCQFLGLRLLVIMLDVAGGHGTWICMKPSRFNSFDIQRFAYPRSLWAIFPLFCHKTMGTWECRCKVNDIHSCAEGHHQVYILD